MFSDDCLGIERSKMLTNNLSQQKTISYQNFFHYLSIFVTAFIAIALTLNQNNQRLLNLSIISAVCVMLILFKKYALTSLFVISIFASVGEPDYLTPLLCIAIFNFAKNSKTKHAILGYATAVIIPILGTTIKNIIGLPIETYTLASQNSPGLGTSIISPYLVIALLFGAFIRKLYRRVEYREKFFQNKIETERSHLFAEIHDSIGNILTIMIALANGARLNMYEEPEKAKDALQKLGVVGADAVEKIRKIFNNTNQETYVINQITNKDSSDVPSIMETVDIFRLTGLPISLIFEGDPLPNDKSFLTQAHRVVQESLVNILRHAGNVTSVLVSLKYQNKSLFISVVDDGHGAKKHASASNGLGLKNIEKDFAGTGSTITARRRQPRGWETIAVLNVGGEK